MKPSSWYASTLLVIFMLVFGFAEVLAQSPSFQVRILEKTVLKATDQVMIRYTIEPYLPDQFFKIEVVCSHDAFREPLHDLRGDEGNAVMSQPDNMEVIWDFKSEYLRGSIESEEFRILIRYLPEASKKFSPVVVVNQERDKVRAGSPILVELKEFPAGIPLKLTLISRDSGVVQYIDLSSIPSKYKWAEAGKSLQPGMNYTISITSLPVFDQSVQGTSRSFTAVKRPPAWIWSLGALPVAAIAWLALRPKENTGDLPVPPLTEDLDPFK